MTTERRGMPPSRVRTASHESSGALPEGADRRVGRLFGLHLASAGRHVARAGWSQSRRERGQERSVVQASVVDRLSERAGIKSDD